MPNTTFNEILESPCSEWRPKSVDQPAYRGMTKKKFKMTQYNNNSITSDNGLIVVQIQTETFVVNTLTIFLQKFNSGGRQKN